MKTKFKLFLAIVLTLVLAFGGVVPAFAQSTSFVDINDSYAKDAIITLQAKGVVDGVDATHFDPKGILTRAQFVAIIVRVLGLKAEGTTSFTDVSGWAVPYVEAAHQFGFIEGVGNGHFDPNGTLTREAAATILVRVLKTRCESFDANATLNFTDASQVSGWAKPFIAAAQKYGLISGYPDGSFKPKGDTNREMGAVMGLNLLNAIGSCNTPVVIPTPTPTPTPVVIGGGGGGGSYVPPTTPTPTPSPVVTPAPGTPSPTPSPVVTPTPTPVPPAPGPTLPASLTTTGATGTHDGKVYQEFKMESDGSQVSLASSNVQGISVLKPNGTTEVLTPNSDSTLWFNVQNPTGDYLYTVTGATYHPTVTRDTYGTVIGNTYGPQPTTATYVAPLYWAGIPVSITNVSLTSNNDDHTKAFNGDTVTLTFTTTEKVEKQSSFKINGSNPNTFTSRPESDHWINTATLLIGAFDPAGPLKFQINVKNTVGLFSTTVEATTDGSYVEVMQTWKDTPVEISNVHISTDGLFDGSCEGLCTERIARVGDTVTLTFTTNEQVMKLSNFKINGSNPDFHLSAGPGLISSPGQWIYVAFYTIQDSDPTGLVNFQINVKNVSNVWSKTIEQTSDGSSVWVYGAASLASTGQTGAHGDSVYEEYKMKVGDNVLDLSSGNVKSITLLYNVLGPVWDPTPKKLVLQPDADPSLWFNVQKPKGIYAYYVVLKSGKSYYATLNWDGATPVEVGPVSVPHAKAPNGKTYALYHFDGVSLAGDHPFDAMYQIKQPTGGTVSIVAESPNGDTNPDLWFNVTKPDGTYTYLIKKDNTWKTGTISVIGTTDITMEPALSVGVGETHEIVASILPASATFTDVVWSSSDEKVATVSAEGIITAVATGTTTITVTTLNGSHSATSALTITEFSSGSGTVADQYVVKNAQQMNNVRKQLSGNFVLGSDIDLGIAPYNQGEGWVPIGDLTAHPFLGHFDGNENTINNLTINRPIAGAGLFASVGSGGQIDNVKMVNVTLTAIKNAGAVAGVIFEGGKVTNSSVSTGIFSGIVRTDPTLTASQKAYDAAQIGGLVGYNYGGTIENSSASAVTINGRHRLGGLVGNNWGVITHSHVNGNSEITGGFEIGGLAGMNYTNTVPAKIENSYANATVTGTRPTDSRTGGLVGDNTGMIANSYAIGSVTGTNYVGGLVASNVGQIDDSYAANRVTATEAGAIVGGLAGQNLLGGTVHRSFYDSQTTGQTDTDRGTPKTTVQMQQQDTFAGWYFFSNMGAWIMPLEQYPQLN